MERSAINGAPGSDGRYGDMMTRANFIDRLVKMYEIQNYDDLAKINQLIDQVAGHGKNDILATMQAEILKGMNQNFILRKNS